VAVEDSGTASPRVRGLPLPSPRCPLQSEVAERWEEAARNDETLGTMTVTEDARGKRKVPWPLGSGLYIRAKLCNATGEHHA
jgi:hypothetical protein